MPSVNQYVFRKLRIYCILFYWDSLFGDEICFRQYAIEYFDCMLIICPVAYYFTYRHKMEKKIRNEKMRRELLEENEKLRSREDKNGGKG